FWFVDVDLAYNHAIALRNDLTVWTWGLNTSGQLGLGHNNSCFIPQKVNSFKILFIPLICSGCKLN
ncbi:hypothetical protein MEO41_28870, partial [Dolichospermum sp. ST_sed4]|nr:hypothetical protein [Dolichospermum sp. ST_sed4]